MRGKGTLIHDLSIDNRLSVNVFKPAFFKIGRPSLYSNRAGTTNANLFDKCSKAIIVLEHAAYCKN